MMRMPRPSAPRGQSLVEFALIAPLLFLLVTGIITLGIAVFYQQQLTNAAREAARYAAIHSATSQCPTTSWRDPNWSRVGPEIDQTTYYACDPPNLRWPEMTSHARERVWGINRSGVQFAACWSGYWDDDPEVNPNAYDAAPSKPDGTPNDFQECTIGDVDPRTSAGSISCPPPLTSPSDDMASNLAASTDFSSANQVTVYACYPWSPPLGGVGFPILCPDGLCVIEIVPSVVTMRAVITEAMQHQQ
jgi:TadE-like protein